LIGDHISYKEILDLIRQREEDGLKSDEIWQELIDKGHNQNEISEAMLHFTREPEKEPVVKHDSVVLKILPIILIILVIGIGAFIIGTDIVVVLLIAAVALFAKAVLYSVILYLIFFIVNSSRPAPFNKCMVSALLISVLSVITIPLAKYLILSIVIFILFMFFETMSLKAYVFFMVFVVIAELFIGIALVNLEARYIDGDTGITTQRFCAMYKRIDIYQQDSIETNAGLFYDRCLNDTGQPTETCQENCKIKEFKCILLDLDFEIHNCTSGCNDGACTR